MKTFEGLVTSLDENQVFVFGSNWDGFHGGGAAGFASFGEPGNVWRQYDYADKEDGWKGLWNVKGQGEGLQEGTQGKSYALPTCAKAGAQRSLTETFIMNAIRRLYACAEQFPDLDFLVAYTTMNHRLLNGYTLDDMAHFFACEDIPENIVFESGFADMVKEALKGEDD